MSSATAETIDDYIATFPKDAQSQLQRVRRTIARSAPKAVEAISYRIPTFKLNGHDLIYFAGFKTHIGLYPVHADGPEFSPQVARYASGKATLKFPLDEPLPIELITQVVKAKLRHAKAPKTRGSQEPGHPPHAPTCTLALPNRSERVEDEGGHSLWLHPCSNPTH